MRTKKEVDHSVSRRSFLAQGGRVLAAASLGRVLEQSDGATIGHPDRNGKTFLNRRKTEGRYYRTTIPDTLDLAERAHLGVKHLMSITSEENNYEMYWGVQKLGLSKEVLEFIGYGGEKYL